jgi:ferrochelatase
MSDGTAVLLMAYGTPATPADIESYYTHIRHGRPPAPEQLAELRNRYERIGGTSPLLEITRRQQDAVQQALARRGLPDMEVALGMKHAHPFIEEAVAELAGRGISRIAGVVLAPHYAAMSVGEYEARAIAAAQACPSPPEVTVASSWHLDPDLLELLGEGLGRTLDEIRSGSGGQRVHVLFTAHSLPARILEHGDPYPGQLRETAQALALRLGLERWSVAWQSAGRTPEPWIGPDVLEAMSELASGGEDCVVVCPVGFVSEHLEILYDLDIEASAHAAELGIRFARTPLPNDDPRIGEALARTALSQLEARAVPA